MKRGNELMIELLRSFIDKQATLGSPFNSADAFYGAMEDFLNDPHARREIATCWLRHQIVEGLAQPASTKSHDEVFGHLKELSERRLRRLISLDTLEIKSSAHAVKIIHQYIKDVDDCVAGVSFESFNDSHFMQALTERAAQVTSHLLRVIAAEDFKAVDAAVAKSLDDIASRITVLGNPVPASELWDAATHLLPVVDKALRVPA